MKERNLTRPLPTRVGRRVRVDACRTAFVRFSSTPRATVACPQLLCHCSGRCMIRLFISQAQDKRLPASPRVFTTYHRKGCCSQGRGFLMPMRAARHTMHISERTSRSARLSAHVSERRSRGAHFLAPALGLAGVNEWSRTPRVFSLAEARLPQAGRGSNRPSAALSTRRPCLRGGLVYAAALFMWRPAAGMVFTGTGAAWAGTLGRSRSCDWPTDPVRTADWQLGH